MSISFAPELGDAVREAAERAGMTLSEWLTEAARGKLRADVDAEEELQRKIGHECMSGLVLDAAALIAIDRKDRAVHSRLRAARRNGESTQR